MLTEISHYLNQTISDYKENDSLIFNHKLHPIRLENFTFLNQALGQKTITFIDGGQAEILAAGNFSLSLIRVAAVAFNGNSKIHHLINEFYLFTKAIYKDSEIFYQSRIFTNHEKLIDETDLFISSNDNTLKTGLERAPINKIANMARRLAELSLAKSSTSDFLILDGTLEKTFLNEEKYLGLLRPNVSALAKSSALFTTSGDSPAVLLQKIGPKEKWFYVINPKTVFVKLHPNSHHLFRFEGNTEVLFYLSSLCKDALFLGYPYGLMVADQLARITNQEKKLLSLQLLLKSENTIISEYLNTSNAHDILDRLQY